MSHAAVDRVAARVRTAGPRARLAALGGLAAVLIWTVANGVFPYHSVNHDEGVYLQQAAMLLEGKLYLTPPVEDAFRPWFFVESEQGLYPKYSPVPAAMFAVGKLLGGYRIALALIAAGCVVLTQRVVARIFDDRTGYVAAVVLLASPLFLVDASVFLPYVPTMLWNLAFAAAYLRADDTGSRRFAALAGLAIGVAFFARPYTAVLFATPFIVHALWTMRSLERATILRQSLTAACGLLGVVAALSYNAVVTGDPLVFPYQAFAPLDGLGFGRRELLGYAVEFTPALGLRATAEALWLLASRWMAAGLLGTAVAILGATIAVRRGLTDRGAILLGIVPSVTLGNVYFWGTMNALGDLSELGDGLSHYLGPYYHVALLLPFTAFAAVGLVALGRRLTAALRPILADRPGLDAWLAAVVVLAAVGGGAAAVAAADPISDNAAVTEHYDAAYEPFAERDLSDAVVLLPTPYEDAWLNHPFQALRNDPGYDEGPVYALQVNQFETLDAFPERTAYRYTYHGNWNPRGGDPVTPRLQRVETVSGSSVATDFTFRTPAYGELLLLTLSGENGSDFASVPLGDGPVAGTIRVEGGVARLTFEDSDVTARIPVADRDRILLRAAVDTAVGTGVTYGLELPVERTESGVRALTPYLELCRDRTLCGGSAGYVRGIFGEDVGTNATLRTGTSANEESADQLEGASTRLRTAPPGRR